MYNNGYNSFYPYQNYYSVKKGLFSNLRGKVNWSNLLNNTQKTLNIINQAIPVMYQIKPIWNNTKTIFKIMGAIKEDDTNKKTNTNTATSTTTINNSSNTTNNTNNNYVDDNSPNFFL